MKKLYILSILLTTINTNLLSCAALQNSNKEEWINILIHGTVGLRANFNVETFFRLLSDSIDGSKYEQNVYSIREHPLLFTVQPMQCLGLQKIKKIQNYPNAPYAFACIFDKLANQFLGPNIKNYYYTFGWSGLLSYKRRFIESFALYEAIRNLLICFKNKKRFPRIRIIAYSHGGNLALNLAALRNQYYPEDNFIIDEFVVMGMPVQKANACMTKGSIFKRIYNVYSKSDSVQKLDIFSPCNVMSKRKFHGNAPSTLTQIEVRVTGRLKPCKDITLPQGLRGIINQSPGHIELWFFGWTNNGYRRNFILHPLPVATLLPYLIFSTRHASCQCANITVDIRPEYENACIIDHTANRKINIPFISHCQLQSLQQLAETFNPHQLCYRDQYLQLQKTLDINKCK